MKKITKRILSEIDCEDLFVKLNKLSQSDLNSVLIELYNMKTSAMNSTDIIKNYRNNRFVKPSEINPIDYHKLEIKILNSAQEFNINPILLSPVAPIGSCSVLGTVDQKNVVSATRGTEVLSDSTNMMAIYIADKLKSCEINHDEDNIHICSTNRLTRAQAFSGPGFFAHFGIYCMVSCGKDKGSYQCEIDLLIKHLEFYSMFLKNYSKSNISILLSKRKGYTDHNGFFNKIVESIETKFPLISLQIDESKEDNQYYKGINYKIIMDTQDGLIEIGDGGFVDWTQKMLSNKKERCLISGISLDRLLLFDNKEV